MSVNRLEKQARENERDLLLVAKARSGEREGLEALYSHYHERVYRSCLHTCRDPEDAVDATQEAFLNVFRKFNEADLSFSSFRDYLFMTSRNVSLKIITKRNRSTPIPEMPEPDGPMRATDDPERHALIGAQRKIVREASASLSRRQVDALTMYEIEGKSYSEIGESLGIEANAVAQLLMRARTRLKKAVRQSAAQTPSSTGCSDAIRLISKKTDGVLADGDRDWLDSHIDCCDTCRANLLVMEEVGTSYRSLAPVPTALAFERVFSDQALAQILVSSGQSVPGPSVGAGSGERTATEGIGRYNLRSRLHDKLFTTTHIRRHFGRERAKTGMGRVKKTAVVTVAILLLTIVAVAPATLIKKGGGSKSAAEKLVSKSTGKDILAAGFAGSNAGLYGTLHHGGLPLTKGQKLGHFVRGKRAQLQSGTEERALSSLVVASHSVNGDDSGGSQSQSSGGGSFNGVDKEKGDKSESSEEPKQPGNRKPLKYCGSHACKLKPYKKVPNIPAPHSPVGGQEKGEQTPPVNPVVPAKPHQGSGLKAPVNDDSDTESNSDNEPKKVIISQPTIKYKIPVYDCTSKIACMPVYK